MNPSVYWIDESAALATLLSDRTAPRLKPRVPGLPIALEILVLLALALISELTLDWTASDPPAAMVESTIEAVAPEPTAPPKASAIRVSPSSASNPLKRTFCGCQPML